MEAMRNSLIHINLINFFFKIGFFRGRGVTTSSRGFKNKIFRAKGPCPPPSQKLSYAPVLKVSLKQPTDGQGTVVE